MMHAQGLAPLAVDSDESSGKLLLRPPSAEYQFRPDAIPFPAGLVAQAFDEFTRVMQHPEMLDKVDCDAAWHLCVAMSDVYAKETARASAVQSVLCHTLKRAASKASIPPTLIPRPDGTRNTADGAVFAAAVDEKEAPLLIIGVKNEQGGSGDAAHVQHSRHWAHHLSHGATPPNRFAPFPMFMLQVVGSELLISAVHQFEGIPSAEPLMPTLHLLATRQWVERVACALRALKAGMAVLETWYQSRSMAAAHTLIAMGLPTPWPRTIAGVRLEYERPLTTRIGQERLLFLAKAADTRVVVKFTPSYGIEAHRHAESVRAAPRVLAYEVLASGWHVVVMEYLSPEDGWVSLKTLSNGEMRTRAARKLQKLYAKYADADASKRYVHGDLHEGNVAVRQGTSGKVHVRVIDWDWAGEEGKVRYPWFLNRAYLQWADGVQDNGVILRAHDDFLITLAAAGE